MESSSKQKPFLATQNANKFTIVKYICIKETGKYNYETYLLSLIYLENLFYMSRTILVKHLIQYFSEETIPDVKRSRRSEHAVSIKVFPTSGDAIQRYI